MYELTHRKEKETKIAQRDRKPPGADSRKPAAQSRKPGPSRYEQITGIPTPEELFTQRIQRILKGEEKLSDTRDEVRAKTDTVRTRTEDESPSTSPETEAPDISMAPMAKAGPSIAPPATESKIASMRQTGGQALPESTREFMESRMGHDFSDVRVHTGPDAEATSQDLNAKAYTVGKDIAFNKGQFDPESREGKKLLAHELTHTIQQGGAKRKVQRKETGKKEAGNVNHKSELHTTLSVVQRAPETIQRAPASRRQQIRAAIRWNRRRHRYTKGLALELYKLARKKEPYYRLKKRPWINEDFVWLVGEVQATLGIRVNGLLDQRTIRAAVKYRGGGKLGWLATMLLNMAYRLVRSIPKWMFVSMGPLGGIFIKGLEGFLDKLRRTSGRDMASLILKTARALVSWPFAKNFILGFLKGFFVDGLLGVFVMIWDLLKIPAQLKEYANSLVKRLGDFSISRGLASIYTEAANQVTWLSRNRGWLWDRLYKLVFSTKSSRLGGIISRIAGFVGKFAVKTGGKIAGMLLNFFSGSSKKVGAALGWNIGRATGFVGFEALIAVLTVGGSAGITAAKTLLRPLIKAVSTGLKYVLKYAKIIYRAISNVATKMSKWLIKTLSKISPTLGKRMGRLFWKIKKFFQGVFDRFKRGPRGKGKRKQRDRDSAKHRILGRRAAKELAEKDGKPKDYPTLREKLGKKARQVAGKYNRKLRRGVKMRFWFKNPKTDRKDKDLDFKVIIAPNATIVSNNSKDFWHDDKIKKEIIKQTSKFKPDIGQCDKCAEHLKDFLKRNQIKGTHIILDTEKPMDRSANIMDLKKNIVISLNGRHEAIMVNLNGKDIVFDNVYPKGLLRKNWLKRYGNLETEIGKKKFWKVFKPRLKKF